MAVKVSRRIGPSVKCLAAKSLVVNQSVGETVNGEKSTANGWVSLPITLDPNID